jgi:Mn-dependent DtxR family transcriptional regulator
MKHAIPDEVLRHHMAFLGKTGSGKTSTEKLVVEQVVDQGFRVCVLDTLKSDWWGITSSASGKSAGLPFKILGGPRGHVPLHSSAGKVIGQLVGSGKLPLSIVDMADFEPGGIQRFFVDFAQSLWKNMKGVVYLVIEEAHEIAPKERAGFGAENMAIHWAKKIATGARTKGIRLMVATQRAQALHNAVLGSCETLIAMRLTQPADQEPVLGWMKANADKDTTERVRASLSSLSSGTGWLCSGEARIFEQVKFPKFRTYDNTATPDQDAAEIDVKTAPVDQDELKTLIGKEIAKAEADDPKKLRERISLLERDNQTLERERDEARQVASDPQAVEDARRSGFRDGFDEAVNQSGAYVVRVKAEVDEAYQSIGAMANTISAIGRIDLQFNLEQKYASASPAASAPPRPQAQTRSARPAPRAPSPAASGDASLSNPQRTLLRSLAWWRAMGHDAVSRAQLAVVCGWSPASSNVRDRLSEVSKLGLVDYPGTGMVRLTDTGIAAAPEPDMSETLIDSIKSILTNPQRVLFQALLTEREERAPVSRAELAAACGWSPDSSNVRDRLSELSRLQLVQYPQSGMVELQPWVLG